MNLRTRRRGFRAGAPAPPAAGALAGEPVRAMAAVSAAAMAAAMCAAALLLGAGASSPLLAAAPPAPALPPDFLDKALAGPMKGVQEVVFAARHMHSDPHWYANFSYYGPDSGRKAYREGARLAKFNLKTGQVTVLLDDPRGGVRDPCVHYDGRKILFSYRKGGTDNHLLYEINADGTGLRQLTDGQYDDIEPVYLPDGDMVFGSSRCKRWVNCWLTQVAILYRCGPNGENVRPISSNNDHDNTPWVLPDGRILYMRWEYVDRSQVHYHHLWTSNPDGTGQMIYYGNLHPGIVMLDAKPIPGTDRVVSIFSPGHGIREHAGPVTVVDPNGGPDVLPMARTVSPRNTWRDPWAFSEDCFLAAGPEGIVLMNGRGATQVLLRKTDAMDLHEPRPLAPRPRERIIPPRVNPDQPAGRLLLADVTFGRNMAGVQPGEIKKLLVLETLPQPVHFSGGMEPISLGGTFILERILGTVPVEPDGSAYFEVPALRSVFFVAMNEKDEAVKRMQSFCTVLPGETTGCTGCHEKREHAFLPTGHLAALGRPPSRIQPVADVPDVFDFPRDIQPILDRHCVRCHNPDKRDGGVTLAGDRGPMYSHSYYTIMARGLVADGRNRPQSNYPPRALGAAASRLMKLLDGSHYDARPADSELKLVRFWIESGAAYPGTYAAPGSGMVGGYVENQLVRTDADWPSVPVARDVVNRRCRSCHEGNEPVPWSACVDVGPPDGKKIKAWLPRHLAFNLTRPEKSLLLLGPLARAAGGAGTCQGRTAADKPGQNVPEVFASAADPDYQRLLAMVLDAKKWL
ncbi:MAG: hypothetical protein FJ288_06560, partial [Planctomycetes bacterium]|nr:hypothetical protein [Planctomycetota bacterium]